MEITEDEIHVCECWAAKCLPDGTWTALMCVATLSSDSVRGVKEHKDEGTTDLFFWSGRQYLAARARRDEYNLKLKFPVTFRCATPEEAAHLLADELMRRPK
jgi:hypothetical protein